MNDIMPASGQFANVVQGLELLESNKYWLRKRLLFNVLVGLAGLIPMLPFVHTLQPFDLAGIVAWGLVANIFYSQGYVLESYVIAKTDGQRNLKLFRNMLFWLGTLLYVLVSVLFALEYFLNVVE